MKHELGPLPDPHMRESYATASNTSSVRKGYEQGGYLRWPDMYTADQMRSYAAAEVARAVAAERAFWMPAIVLAQQCIAEANAGVGDRPRDFYRLSDEFDDACADALLRLKPD